MRFLPASRRSGAIVPLTAISLVALIGMVALCVDLSLLALGKTQCQNVADMSAMAAARSLDGIVSTNNNVSAAFANGKTTAAAGKVLGQPVQASQATVRIGILTYNSSASPPAFQAANLITESAAGPPPSGYNWGMAESRVTASVNFNFARIFGLTSMPVEAVAQAVHRPRDVAIIMDYSGSMGFDSYLARPQSGSSSNPPNSSLNNDPRVPRFGHYDPNTTYTSSGTNPPTREAGLVNSELSMYSGDYVRTDTNEILKVGNQTYTTSSGTPIIEDFYTLRNGGMVRAFSTGGPLSSPVTAYDASGFPTAIPNWTGNLGDRPSYVNNTPTFKAGPGTPETLSVSYGTQYLKRALQFARARMESTTPNANPMVPIALRQDAIENLNSANTLYSPNMAGFTYGPGQWGKTFFIWPPIPDATSNPEVTNSTTNTNTAIRDWRQRFFWARRSGGSTKKRLDDNNILWQSSGAPRRPTSSYTDANGVAWIWEPNYEAILEWLRNTGPNPLPDNLRAGRILYYDAIPTTVANFTTDLNQRFWKEYIDWVVGYSGYADSGTNGMNLRSGYGNDFEWEDPSNPAAIYAKPSNWIEIGRMNASYSSGRPIGTALNVRTASYSDVSATMLNWLPPNGTQIRVGSATSGPTYTLRSAVTNTNQWTISFNEATTASISSGVSIFANLTPAYMDYRDNPFRPKHRFWFGPLTLGDFLWGEFDSRWRAWRPGNCSEAPMWVLKTGIQAALVDIEKNHPNDWVSLINFSVPKSSAGDSDNSRRFNRPRGPLGKNYQYMQNALWYPPAVIQTDGSLVPRTGTGGEIRPFTESFNVDQDYREAPFAAGGTCPMWGFTLAYNQFSSNSALLNYDNGQPVGMAGGRGRLGARKLVVFETDGVPNHRATAGFTNAGAGQSYFNCRMPSEYPSVSSDGNMASTTITETYRLVRTLCDNATGNQAGNVSAYVGPGNIQTIARATGRPGYSTTTRPVLVHSLAFGGLFESDSSLKPQCLGFLQTVQAFGNTQTNPNTPLASEKVVIGTSDERIDKIKTAFTNIMQDGVQITLYK